MQKLINAALLVTSLCCYLEWGGGNSGFLFRMQYDVLFNSPNTTSSLKHPAIFIPFTGQLLLLITLFQKHPSKRLSLAGLILLGVLVLFIFLIGILSGNLRILFSTLPFIATAVYFFVYNRKQAGRSIR